MISLVLLLNTCYTLLQRRQRHPTPVLLPGKSHGRRSLVGCSPWGRWELDTTEWLHFHFSLSCIGEGNGNLLQCSCLENPRDGGAWWAAIYGVAWSRTRLKLLSSSSSIPCLRPHITLDLLFPLNSRCLYLRWPLTRESSNLVYCLRFLPVNSPVTLKVSWLKWSITCSTLLYPIY